MGSCCLYGSFPSVLPIDQLQAFKAVEVDDACWSLLSLVLMDVSMVGVAWKVDRCNIDVEVH